MEERTRGGKTTPAAAAAVLDENKTAVTTAQKLVTALK